MENSFKDNVLNGDTWLRLVFILLFWFLLTVVGWVLGAVIVVQFFIVLFDGKRNAQLADFGNRLGTYLKDMVLYLTFNSEEKPFPFSDFPASKQDSLETDS